MKKIQLSLIYNLEGHPPIANGFWGDGSVKVQPCHTALKKSFEKVTFSFPIKSYQLTVSIAYLSLDGRKKTEMP